MAWTPEKKRRVRKERKMKLIESKGRKCERCGGEFSCECFDFHHRDPRVKEFTINQDYLTRRSWEVIEKEAAKCALLCANCHRTVHAQQEDEYFEDLYCRHRDERINSRPKQMSLFGDWDDGC